MDSIHSAIIGAPVALWRWIRVHVPLMPERGYVQLQLKEPIPLWKKILQTFAKTLLVIFVFGVMGFMFYLTATRSFPDTRAFVFYNLQVFRHATTTWIALFSPVILLFTIWVSTNLEVKFPKMNFAIPDLWRKEKKAHVNVVLLPAQHRIFGLSYTALLLLTVPIMASWEEMLFRDKDTAEGWFFIGSAVAKLPDPLFVILWSVIGFGLIHMLSGVSLNEAIVLGFVGGMYFAFVYWNVDGIVSAVIAHASYNILAIGYMVSPDLRQMIARSFIRSGEEVQRSI